jgi:hypothetical protein
LGETPLELPKNMEFKDDDEEEFFKTLEYVNTVFEAFLKSNTELIKQCDETVQEFEDRIDDLILDSSNYGLNIDSSNRGKIFPTVTYKGKTYIHKDTKKKTLKKVLTEKIKDGFLQSKKKHYGDYTKDIKKDEDRWNFEDLLFKFGNTKDTLTSDELKSLRECVEDNLAYIIFDNEYVSEYYLTEFISDPNNSERHNKIPHLLHMSRNDLQNRLGNLHLKLEEGEDPVSLFHYIDSQRKTISYREAIFRPMKKEQDGVYNFFRGFKHQKKDGQEDPSEFEVDMTKVEKITNHILLVWCKNDKECYEYVLNWFAHILQKPWIKIGVMISLLSDEGVGKSVIIESFNKFVLGKEYGLVVNTVKDITEKFNSLGDRRCLVVFDDPQDMDDRARKAMKMLITSEDNVVRRKFKESKSSINYANYIQFCNHKKDLNDVSPSDRRNFIMEADNSYAGKTPEGMAYFTKHYAELEDGENYKHLAHSLMQRDISSWDPREYPETDIMNTMKSKNLDPILKFFEAVIGGTIKTDFDDIANYSVMEAGKERKFPTNELFSKFKLYDKINSKKYSLQMLTKDITKYKLGLKADKTWPIKTKDKQGKPITEKRKLMTLILEYDAVIRAINKQLEGKEDVSQPSSETSSQTSEHNKDEISEDEKPFKINLIGDRLTWEKVEGRAYYQIEINGKYKR